MNPPTTDNLPRPIPPGSPTGSSAQTVEALVTGMTCLADDTRLRLLRLLEGHELGVGELGQVLQLPQPTVSRHLKTLADAGFVVSRREGTSNLYRMVLGELTPGLQDLWQVARREIETWPELQQDRGRLTELLREKMSASRVFFAGAAGEWDRLRTELYGEAFTTSALLSLLPATAVLADLGCGTGATAATLAPFVPRGQVFAIDNSPEMLAAARDRCRGLSNVSVLEGELTKLPIGTASCDGAFLILALTYVADLQPVLAEAARILKPTGRLIIVDLLPHAREDFRRKLNQLHSGFAAEALTTALTNSGLTETSITPLPTPPAAKGPSLFLAVATRA